MLCTAPQQGIAKSTDPTATTEADPDDDTPGASTAGAAAQGGNSVGSESAAGESFFASTTSSVKDEGRGVDGGKANGLSVAGPTVQAASDAVDTGEVGGPTSIVSEATGTRDDSVNASTIITDPEGGEGASSGSANVVAGEGNFAESAAKESGASTTRTGAVATDTTSESVVATAKGDAGGNVRSDSVTVAEPTRGRDEGSAGRADESRSRADEPRIRADESRNRADESRVRRDREA